MSRRPISLALRVTARVGLATCLLFLGFGWVIERSIEHHFAEQDAGVLAGVAKAVVSALDTRAPQIPLHEVLARAVSAEKRVYVVVTAADGSHLYASPGPGFAPLLSSALPVERITPGSLYVWREDGSRYRGAMLRAEAGPTGHSMPITIAVAMPTDFHQHFLDWFQRTLWMTTAFACLLAIAAAWFAVQRGHAPLRDISARIRGITSARLDTRLSPEAVPVELAELATSFNDMLERIEDSFRRLSSVSADIAHELRTPVTNLATQTQVALGRARNAEAYREILYSNLEEYERMGKMIGDMLFLAQADNRRLRLERDAVDLVDEVRALFDFFEAWAEDRHVSLRLEGEARKVPGDRLMLRRAASNLLGNAIRHTAEGGTVTVRLAESDESVTLTVENSGPAIERVHLDHLFERFYRADPSRQRKGEGAGLGLAIVKSIAEAHGGSASVDSVEGQTHFHIRLPRRVAG
ncbi:two-component sensor histidine kinase [Acidihalobacter yilgarnensis]|uniref:Sensor protein n=1 Tax=Acidihalobacter yilgarnensis TaxID=2819280 RepID=A0A1D8IN35_9GAMM|nr:Cu(+)/Ag(+) sensor histidine kinase [Acidihalobacter yilgarnensis]AOU97883.1 two-component sensor histidine kinase [Acidihalobacter yilgarnensis]